jgi:hypothetical protein
MRLQWAAAYFVRASCVEAGSGHVRERHFASRAAPQARRRRVIDRAAHRRGYRGARRDHGSELVSAHTARSAGEAIRGQRATLGATSGVAHRRCRPDRRDTRPSWRIRPAFRRPPNAAPPFRRTARRVRHSRTGRLRNPQRRRTRWHFPSPRIGRPAAVCASPPSCYHPAREAEGSRNGEDQGRQSGC